MVLRAVEIEADCILAAKAIDGVYDSDPAKNPEAKKYDRLSIAEVVEQKLGVIDLAASVLCMENQMPMKIFGLFTSIPNRLKGVLQSLTERITVCSVTYAQTSTAESFMKYRNQALQ
jgi:uridylate kinase